MRDWSSDVCSSDLDRAYVLESGRTVMEGTGQALLNDDRLVQAYLGINQRQTVYT